MRLSSRVECCSQYHVLAVLTDAAGNTHQTSVRQVLAAGDNTIRLGFDGSDIHRNRTDGPYTLSTVRVVQERDMDLLPTQDLENAHATAAYA